MGDVVLRRRRVPDRDARDRISRDLGSTLFVEAGAGAGKTTALVDRVVALVISGDVELERVAAVTFTEKAGAELRDRLRRSLQERIGSAEHDGAGNGKPAGDDPADIDTAEVIARCRLALDQLDRAALGTLHSFAQRILSEHPIEAGLPPRVEVLDEVTSGVEFQRRWSAFRDRLLDDPALERPLLLLFAAGVRPQALDALAANFEDNWDLVVERVPAEAPEPPPVAEVFAPALAALDVVCAERRSCSDQSDLLYARLCAIHERVDELRSFTDELDLLSALAPDGGDSQAGRPGFKVGNLGRAKAWPDVVGLRSRVATAGALLEQARMAIVDACAHRLGAAIRTFTLEAAAERRSAGRLEFHDLLVMARALLTDGTHGGAVRARLHQRYARLLLDEFQDTDPIQIELAVRIAAADPRDERVGSASWEDIEVAASRLFFVGDPKQSIYRFRRADIGTFLAARACFGRGPSLVELTTNFRAGEPLVDWFNSVFGALMGETPELELDVPSQPDYIPVQAVRPGPTVGPAVAVIGRSAHHDVSADELRAAEASDVAGAIATAIAEGWSVDDGASSERAARLGDIAILVPARTSLPFLQDALDQARIPYRTESSSLVYATRAVRDVLMVLRAVSDPTNELHVVSALRTPLLACGDDDLFRFRVERGGRWSYLIDPPDAVPDDDPVRRGLAFLRAVHEQRHWTTPSELLDFIVRDRRALELGFAEGRPRDVWRRIRFVIDQARAWTEATHGTLRQYLFWVDTQSAEGSRVSEAVLPETDDDAVRIMTIHAAKGLEFPITIVSGLSTVPMARAAAAEVVFPREGRVGYRFAGKIRTAEYDEWKPIDEQMGYDERVRLLYVACTRARDHLVVSLHRRARSSAPRPTKRTNAELLVDGMGLLLGSVRDAAADPASMVPRPVAPPPPIAPLAAWQSERDDALRRAARPGTVAATTLSAEGEPDGADTVAGLQKQGRDLDLPPWLKGRYGTAVGRAVHGVLQTIPLVSCDGLDAAVVAQCEAEAIPERVAVVRGLVVAALASPSVREAAESPHWREVYACVPVGGRLLEGYVDLLYRGRDGLVIVDYKTAATVDKIELERRVLGYRLQGASYARMVAAATGESVARVTFVFLTPGGAAERHLGDLQAAVEDVDAVVVSGQEIIADERG
jgi:ATP-dependent exoDNAse (exonuclease V) beta subunit